MPDKHYNPETWALPHPKILKKLPGLTGIYINSSLRSIGISLTGIFIPIFVYRITESLASTIFFFVVWETIQILALIPSARFISRIGPELSTLISNLTYGIYLVFLTLSLKNPIFIWYSLPFVALTVPLYWLPHHLAFFRRSNRRKIGSQVSDIMLLRTLVSIVAPFLGGLLADYFGFRTLYVLALFFVFFSSLPILLDTYNTKDSWPGLKAIIKGQKEKGLSSYTKAFFGTGVEAAFYGVIWPLFLYSAIKDVKLVGLLSTITGFVYIFTLKLSGRYVKKLPRKMVRLGTLGMSGSLALRSVFFTPLLLGLGDILYRLSSAFVWVPFQSRVYCAKKKNIFVYFIDREISIHFGKLLGLMVALFITNLGLPLPALSLLGIFGLTLVYSWAKSNLNDR